jgi:hypothetical protein
MVQPRTILDAVRLAVDDHQRDDASETTQAWDSVRRIREPVAWALLAIAAIIVLVSACQLFNIAGATIPVAGPATISGGPSPVPVSAFALRASSVTPQFIDAAVQVMPVLAVVLVAFIGGLTERARQVVQAAAAVLALAFVLGLVSLVGAAGTHLRPGTWFILEAAGLAITATALIFTGIVMRSRELRSAARQSFWDEDDDDFEEDA